MTVIKRDRTDSNRDLINAIAELVTLLKDQKEDDACADLQEASSQLSKASPASPEHKAAISKIVDAFEGDHELNAYILEKPDADSWTIVEQLSQASARVLSLARRLR